jgi:hypothetical protein
MHPTPVTRLAKEQARLDSWNAIMALSTQINAQVELQNWSLLLALAEQRDHKVTAFLAQSIPNAMYTQVMLDIDHLQQQHALIKSELARHQAHSREKQRQIRNVIDELDTSKATTNKAAEIESVLHHKNRH